MSNKISIDDLFREKLSGGKEQLNLGAWANMERMLNGQNPYAGEEQEPKRKKRIFPFLALFLLLSSAVTAGFLWFNHQNNQSTVQATAHTNESPNNQTNLLTQNANNNANTSQVKDIDASMIPSESSLQVDQPIKNNHKINQKHFAKNNQINNQSNNQSINQTNNQTNGQTTETVDAAMNQLASKVAKHEKGNKRNHKDVNKENPENSIEVEQNQKETLLAYNNENQSKKATFSKKQSESKDLMNQSKKELVYKVVADEMVEKNRDGSIKTISYDTIDQSSYEVAKQYENPQPIDYTQKNYKYHPRYLLDEIQVEEPKLVLNNALKNEPASTPHLKNTSDEKTNKKNNTAKTGIFSAIGAFATLALNKIGETSNDFFRMFTVLDPGISLGVNAALFNTKHNYGGFQAGLTNHTAISETFSIISELKFFIRNNSGFTVNDIKTQIINKSIDTSIPGQTTYMYQVDSLTKKYNFKNFMSLELPIMLSARFNNLSLYGGPNFVYNLKFNINEINKNYVLNKQETVANGIAYEYPIEKGMQYTSTDFGARFGIGYAVGVSYNFNPKVYLDLRLSKVMWDNTKTNSQRDISNGVSKVPFTQLSLGYKFSNK
ncbi:MAG TPA: hypothetical protein PKC41_00825 [Chitinophagaceae bacterium]|jgi:3D (Asp-Asp-Asp) domain-containing protein|nr:hypothetical protein [Chitinophagaceae bacterium]